MAFSFSKVNRNILVKTIKTRVLIFIFVILIFPHEVGAKFYKKPNSFYKDYSEIVSSTASCFERTTKICNITNGTYSAINNLNTQVNTYNTLNIIGNNVVFSGEYINLGDSNTTINIVSNNKLTENAALEARASSSASNTINIKSGGQLFIEKSSEFIKPYIFLGIGNNHITVNNGSIKLKEGYLFSGVLNYNNINSNTYLPSGTGETNFTLTNRATVEGVNLTSVGYIYLYSKINSLLIDSTSQVAKNIEFHFGGTDSDTITLKGNAKFNGLLSLEGKGTTIINIEKDSDSTSSINNIVALSKANSVTLNIKENLNYHQIYLSAKSNLVSIGGGSALEVVQSDLGSGIAKSSVMNGKNNTIELNKSAKLTLQNEGAWELSGENNNIIFKENSTLEYKGTTDTNQGLFRVLKPTESSVINTSINIKGAFNVLNTSPPSTDIPLAIYAQGNVNLSISGIGHNNTKLDFRDADTVIFNLDGSAKLTLNKGNKVYLSNKGSNLVRVNMQGRSTVSIDNSVWVFDSEGGGGNVDNTIEISGVSNNTFYIYNEEGESAYATLNMSGNNNKIIINNTNLFMHKLSTGDDTSILKNTWVDIYLMHRGELTIMSGQYPVIIDLEKGQNTDGSKREDGVIAGDMEGFTTLNTNYNPLSLIGKEVPQKVYIKGTLQDFDEFNLGLTPVEVNSINDKKDVLIGVGIASNKSDEKVNNGFFKINKIANFNNHDIYLKLLSYGYGNVKLPFTVRIMETASASSSKNVIKGIDHIYVDSVIFKVVKTNIKPHLVEAKIAKCLTIAQALSGEECKIYPSSPEHGVQGLVRIKTQDPNILSIANALDRIIAENKPDEEGDDIKYIINKITSNSAASDMSYNIGFVSTLEPINNDVLLNISLTNSEMFIDNFLKGESITPKKTQSWGIASYTKLNIKNTNYILGTKVNSVNISYGQELNNIKKDHLIGFITNYANGSFKSNKNYTSQFYQGSIQGFSLSVYDKYKATHFLYLKSIASLSMNLLNLKRTISYNYEPNTSENFSEKVLSNPFTSDFSLATSSIYKLPILSKVFKMPLYLILSGGGQYDFFMMNGYKEKGFGALNIQPTHSSVFQIFGSTSFEKPFKISHHILLPKVIIEGRYRIINNISNTEGDFISTKLNDTIINYSPKYNNLYITPSTSITYFLGYKSSVSLKIAENINKDMSNMSLSLKFVYNF